MKRKKLWRRAGIVLLCLAAAGVVALLCVNGYVKAVGRARLITAEEAAKAEGVDCIVVLGCQVRADGSLSPMLHDRLARAVALYEAGAAPKLLMSGDHGQDNYNEVGAMKQYAVAQGVPSEDVFMDHAGFSTYDTVYRVREIFGAKKVIIVTQEYHLYRALYIARQLGLDAWGVAAAPNEYAGQGIRDAREVLARCKDFAKCIVRPEATYLGEAIPVSGNGDVTNDE